MNYLIANLVMAYEPQTEEFASFLAPFACEAEREADITLRFSREQTEALLKRMTADTTFAQAESFGVGDRFNRAVIRFQAMLVHSSAIVCDGKAYLFSAASGVGKSTHTRLWLRQFGDRVHIMNDDKPVVRLYEDEVIVHGTPFDGGSGIALNESYPLGAIVFVERGERNSVRVPTDAEVIQNLYFQTAHMVGAKTAEMMLENFDLLIGRARFYVLTCNMEPEAAVVAYRAIIHSEM